jgi:hypothetical protein
MIFLPVENAGTPCVIPCSIKAVEWSNRQLVFHEFLWKTEKFILCFKLFFAGIFP